MEESTINTFCSNDFLPVVDEMSSSLLVTFVSPLPVYKKKKNPQKIEFKLNCFRYVVQSLLTLLPPTLSLSLSRLIFNDCKTTTRVHVKMT